MEERDTRWKRRKNERMGWERKEGREKGGEFITNTVKQNVHVFEYMLAHWMKSKTIKRSKY